jgi:hypothetical protein
MKSLFEHIITNSSEDLTEEQKNLLSQYNYNSILSFIITDFPRDDEKLMYYIEKKNSFIYNMVNLSHTEDLIYLRDALLSVTNPKQKEFIKEFIQEHFDIGNFYDSVVELLSLITGEKY